MASFYGCKKAGRERCSQERLNKGRSSVKANEPNLAVRTVLARREIRMNLENMLINGEWVRAASHRSFTVYNPANGAVVGKAPAGSADDAILAINAADAAFNT